jgi:Transposase DDE domain group 1
MVKDNLGFTFAAARQTLTSVAGLELLTSLIRRLGLIRAIRSEVRVKKIDYGFREEEHLIPLVLNIALRRTSYTDLAWLAKEQKLLKKSLGFSKLPKERAVAMHLEKYNEEHIAGLKRVGAGIVSQATITAEPGDEGYIPCDIDPSIFEQFAPKREGVETTYNGKLCYTPVFAVVGRERFCINHWLLPGREKALERIDEFIRECEELLPGTIDRSKLLFRYDAGLYSIKTVKASEDAKAYYLVKARSSAALDQMVNKNLDVDVLDLKVTDFGGEYFGEFEYTPKEWKTPRRFVFCVQIKAEDEEGQPLLIRDVRYHILATNLPKEVSPQRAFELYRGRGAAEEANKELKHDLDLERLPSQTFSVNEVFLTLGTMAYNLLILLGQQWRDEHDGAEATQVRRRIKTIQDYLLRSAAVVVSHAHKSLLKVNTWWLEKLRPDRIQARIGRLLPIT